MRAINSRRLIAPPRPGSGIVAGQTGTLEVVRSAFGNVRFVPKADSCTAAIGAAFIGRAIAAELAKCGHFNERGKAVLTVVGAVYGGVDLSWGHLGSIRHGSIFYRARSDSRGWRCFFPVRDGTA